MKKIFFSIIPILFVITQLMRPGAVYATTCTPGINGDLHIGSDCSFSGDNGVDAGTGVSNTATLYIDSGNIVIQPNQIIGVGRIIIATGASLTLPANGSGSIRPGGSVWMLDADDDYYPANTTQIVSSSSPGGGYVRRSQEYAVDQSHVDCYDSGSNANKAFPGQTVFQTSSARGDASWDYDCSGGTTYKYETCSCGACSGNSCGSSLNCSVATTTTIGAYTCGASIDAGPSSCSQTSDPIYGTCLSCSNAGTTNYTVGCL